jgi:ElaB/YqjD/DUF883 family membrane-anchored ribosome-binding protein
MSRSTSIRNNGRRTHTVRDDLTTLNGALRTGMHDAVESGRKVVDAASATATDLARSARDAAYDTRERIGRTISDRPYTSVAVAAGLGAAALGVMMMLRRR